jgi:TRAP-type mannitol/chloroaromatic compound transport system permease small subunit
MDAKGYILLAVGIIVLAAVVPAAITSFFAADTSGWDAGTVALWTVIPLVIVAVLLLSFFRGSGKGE